MRSSSETNVTLSGPYLRVYGCAPQRSAVTTNDAPSGYAVRKIFIAAGSNSLADHLHSMATGGLPRRAITKSTSVPCFVRQYRIGSRPTWACSSVNQTQYC